MQQTVSYPPTVHDLMVQGFSAFEIARLQRLKDDCDPYREYCESNREFERLAFLKWRYEQELIQQR